MDLELCTTEELLVELTRRATFQGVVLVSQDEFKGQAWRNEAPFVLVSANLTPDQVIHVMASAVQHLREEEPPG
jgi:hypothetical protein